jgi:hypothetical protein
MFATLACLNGVFASNVLTDPKRSILPASNVEQPNIDADVPDAKSGSARVDGLVPSIVAAGSPDTRFDVIGTGLDRISRIDVLDQNDNWKQLSLSPISATHVKITVPSSYVQEARFLTVATEPNVKYAQSVLINSKTVAGAIVDPRFKIKVTPEDIGGGGGISVSGTGFTSGMRVALGRGGVAGVLVESHFVNDSYLEAVVKPGYLPASDLFVTLLSADGKTRSEPVPVVSSYQQSEDDASQHQAAESPSDPNEKGMKLMKQGSYDAAAEKFVEAARLDPSSIGSAPFVNKVGAVFANNAGFAFFKANKNLESLFWLNRACQIDPSRSVAYLNLGDLYAKLNRNADARHAYAKFLELAPDSKAAPEVKKKLDSLPLSP